MVELYTVISTIVPHPKPESVKHDDHCHVLGMYRKTKKSE